MKTVIFLGPTLSRLTVEQAAWVLGCQSHDVPILIASRLLKPLGNPPQNGFKFFSMAEVTEMSKDRVWLDKMTHKQLASTGTREMLARKATLGMASRTHCP